MGRHAGRRQPVRRCRAIGRRGIGRRGIGHRGICRRDRADPCAGGRNAFFAPGCTSPSAWRSRGLRAHELTGESPPPPRAGRVHGLRIHGVHHRYGGRVVQGRHDPVERLGATTKHTRSCLPSTLPGRGGYPPGGAPPLILQGWQRQHASIGALTGWPGGSKLGPRRFSAAGVESAVRHVAGSLARAQAREEVVVDTASGDAGRSRRACRAGGGWRRRRAGPAVVSVPVKPFPRRGAPRKEFCS